MGIPSAHGAAPSPLDVLCKPPFCKLGKEKRQMLKLLKMRSCKGQKQTQKPILESTLVGLKQKPPNNPSTRKDTHTRRCKRSDSTKTTCYSSNSPRLGA